MVLRLHQHNIGYNLYCVSAKYGRRDTNHQLTLLLKKSDPSCSLCETLDTGLYTSWEDTLWRDYRIPLDVLFSDHDKLKTGITGLLSCGLPKLLGGFSNLRVKFWILLLLLYKV